MPKSKNTDIFPDHPDYEELFWKHWGSGQSLTGRQAVHIGRSLKNAHDKQQESQQESDSSQPSSESTED